MQSMPPAEERESAYELFQRGSRMLADRHPGAAPCSWSGRSRSSPARPRSSRPSGQAYFNQGDHLRAPERFGAIVEADPLAHYAHFGLGLSRARIGDVQAARRHLRMAVFLKPDNESYQRALSRLGDAA